MITVVQLMVTFSLGIVSHIDFVIKMLHTTTLCVVVADAVLTSTATLPDIIFAHSVVRIYVSAAAKKKPACFHCAVFSVVCESAALFNFNFCSCS